MKPGDLAAAKAAADQLFDADEKARELLGSLAPGFYTNSMRRLEMTPRHDATPDPIKRTGWIICRPHLISSGNYNLEPAYSVLFPTEEKAREAFGDRFGDYQIAKVEWEE